NLKPFERYVDPVEQTARFCGMHWEPPLIVFGSQTISDAALALYATDFRARLEAFTTANPAGEREAAKEDAA
ncbi:MAG: hypothetical protein ABI831_21800, partial [Betaproteobacteria bacterium]